MQYCVIRKASEILVIKLTNKKEISASFKFSINKSAKKKKQTNLFLRRLRHSVLYLD